ncbi:hypothetical protein SIID45300_01741 [Candidatus Magnetaquicoccaceae bacterium FCR-1]|uniref:Uncharacterized protein n=1 Tax=Candidatus Magnetaquiglobus chichijimensis TaxID=3141448 RepID=A0ABQ0C956_9PROT
MKNRIQLSAGDSFLSLTFTLRDRFVARPGFRLDPYDPSSMLPVDLDKIETVTVSIRKRQAVLDPAIHVQAIRLRPRDAGVCVLPWTPDTFATPGVYEGEITLTDAVGAVETVVEKLVFEVRERLT